MTLTEELMTQAQNFDKGSALRGLLERAAHRITELERQQPTEERRKAPLRKDV